MVLPDVIATELHVRYWYVSTMPCFIIRYWQTIKYDVAYLLCLGDFPGCLELFIGFQVRKLLANDLQLPLSWRNFPRHCLWICGAAELVLAGHDIAQYNLGSNSQPPSGQHAI